MEDITYRKAIAADAGLLAPLAQRIFTETFGHMYRREDLDAYIADQTPGRWRRDIADPTFAIRLCMADGKPIGFVKLGPPTLPNAIRRPTMELRQFYVRREWQGAGVAPRMMRWALAEARSRGAVDMQLSVFVDNHRAKRFYLRYGFRRIGTYAFMVGEQADEDDVMRLAL